MQNYNFLSGIRYLLAKELIDFTLIVCLSYSMKDI